ncbi:MAG: glycosyl hydrolase-related protein [Thermodesulfovibrio sp.]|nr:glycosyl hydrolase-related protein [Thermodesulfovibrio sp.]
MKAHIITHTHWDREWYVTFEIFRHRLLELMDLLVNELEKRKEFKYFLLDGQVVILEDYLEIRPENKDRLINLIKKGKISVGPWYILPDEFLIMGESFVRNYLYGKKILQSLGINGMNIGYLPDMFGHNAYTPVVLKELGLKAGVVWRGVGSKSRKTEFIWEAPNGDGILTLNLIRSYSNGAHFGGNIHELKEKFKREIEELKNYATTENILIMNGTDHEIPIMELPEKFSEWSKEFGVEIIHSNLENYTEEVLRENPKLEKIIGELRDPTYEPILKDVTSTRVYLKILNFEAQLLYLRYLEPLSAIAKTLNINPRINELDYGWKNILKSHPHDSICGCSIDRVHRDVETRLYSALENGLGILTKLMNDIPINLGERDKDINICVFNPLERDGKRIVELYASLDSPEYEIYDLKGNRIESHIEPIGIPIEEIFKFSSKRNYIFLSSMRGFFKEINPMRDFMNPLYKISFMADLPSLSFTSFTLKKREYKENKKLLESTLDFENNFYFFHLNNDGTFNIYDKINQVELKNINYFEDQGDIGDEYNFSPTEGEPLKVVPQVKVLRVRDKEFLKEIILEGKMDLPISAEGRKRNKEKVSIPFNMTYTLYRDFPRIDVSIDLENKAWDHRIRFGLDLPEDIEIILNDGYYGIVEHETKVNNSKEYVEENIPRYAMESFVSIIGDKTKIMVVTRGLHEYEVERKERETSLKITLLRSVGYLSRGDLTTRKGHAGPFIPTPEGQCIGRYNFEYSFIILNSSKEQELYEKSRNYLIYPVAISLPLRIKDWSFMDIPSELFLTALKISEDGEGIILRVVNIGDEGVYSLKSNIFNKAFIVDMKEDEKEELEGDREWKINFRKGEVKTIKFLKS